MADINASGIRVIACRRRVVVHTCCYLLVAIWLELPLTGWFFCIHSGNILGATVNEASDGMMNNTKISSSHISSTTPNFHTASRSPSHTAFTDRATTEQRSKCHRSESLHHVKTLLSRRLTLQCLVSGEVSCFIKVADPTGLINAWQYGQLAWGCASTWSHWTLTGALEGSRLDAPLCML